MSHYFTPAPLLPHDERVIDYELFGERFSFVTDAGVFSRDGVDHATDILLRTLPDLSGTLLDLGCGFGCAGIVLVKRFGVTLWQTDVNPRAVELTKRNCERNGVVSTVLVSDCFEAVPQAFDAIVLNPPIHAGKAVTYRMYEEAPAHLNPGGCLYVVTLQKHGAESTRTKLANVFGSCETLYKKKGVFVLCARRG